MARGLWSEMLAELVLELKGYEVKQRRYTVQREGVKLAEIDLIAEKDGKTYAVEIKSGRISVTDVRQAFSNARLTGMRPLIVARGFADDSARRYAEELGVEALLYPDYLVFIGPEELQALLEKAMSKFFLEILSGNPKDLDDEDWETVNAIAESKNLAEAARKLGVTERELGRKIGELRSRGTLTVKGDYDKLRLQCLYLRFLRKR